MSSITELMDWNPHLKLLNLPKTPQLQIKSQLRLDLIKTQLKNIELNLFQIQNIFQFGML